jgi:hypothetical protein
MILGRPDTIIVVAPELASFYDFVKGRQEAEYGNMVVLLDRRQGERRRAALQAVGDNRRLADRRARAEAASASLSVLGFAFLHREGERYIA